MTSTATRQRPGWSPLALAALLAALSSPPAHAAGGARAAEEPAPRSPFHFNYSVEIPLLVGSVSVTAIPVLFQAESPRSEPAPLTRDRVFFLDRSATYYHSQAAANLSYGLTAAIPALAVGASLPWGRKKWAESREDLFLLSEMVAFTSLTNQLVRNAFRRPRPYLYRKQRPYTVSEREDLASFFSGHAAMAFALGIGFWHIRDIRSPEDPSNPYLLAGGITAGVAMALTRVFSGYHFWTDAAAGAAVGTAFGYVIPELHKADPEQPGAVAVAPIANGGLAVSLRI